MPSRKRPADAAPDGAAAAAKKAGIVQLLEVIATHQMDPGLIEAVENDLTPALLEELRTEHPAAEWSYRSMWLRGLSRRAMNGLPRSGSPMMMSTWRTPSVPAVAAIGGGTAVGIGLFDVGLSRCAFDSSYTSVSLLPRFDMRSTGGGEGSEGAATSSSGGRSDDSESIRSTSFSLSSTLLLIFARLTRRARLTR